MVYVFAYGSNMLNSRMQSADRAPGARPIGIAELTGYEFACNKRSTIDATGKGNIRKAEGKTVWGVVFEMPEADLKRLDEKEGGYDRSTIQVDLNGTLENVETYISNNLVETPPTAEYMDYIIDGAREHGLPTDYLAMLESIPTHN